MAATTGISPGDNAHTASPDWRDFVHTGPGTLAGRYLRMFWQPVYLARDLEPGRARPVTIMSEPFTLYRGEGGSPHLLAFRCAHRGTQLSTGWVEGDDIRCFYHGWKYDGSGQCVEQPAEPDPFCEKIRLRSYPVEEYLGFILAYLGEGQPPRLPRYPDFEAFDGVVQSFSGPVVPCNYFNRLDNDPVHPAFVHRQTGSTIPLLDAEETDYGMIYHTRYPTGFVGTAYHYMPNISHFSATPAEPGLARRQGIAWRVPVDDEHYNSFLCMATPVLGTTPQRSLDPGVGHGSGPPVEELAKAVLAGTIPVQELEGLGFRHAVDAQDYVSLVGQGVIADREHEHLGQSDVTVILFRSLWERELRALAEGKPLKQWTRPDRLVANSE